MMTGEIVNLSAGGLDLLVSLGLRVCVCVCLCFFMVQVTHIFVSSNVYRKSENMSPRYIIRSYPV